MEEFRKNPNWRKEKEPPCHKCSNGGMCMMYQCNDWDEWYKYQTPNEETIKALRDAKEGKNLTTCSSIEELMEELEKPE